MMRDGYTLETSEKLIRTVSSTSQAGSRVSFCQCEKRMWMVNIEACWLNKQKELMSLWWISIIVLTLIFFIRADHHCRRGEHGSGAHRRSNQERAPFPQQCHAHRRQEEVYQLSCHTEGINLASPFVALLWHYFYVNNIECGGSRDG